MIPGLCGVNLWPGVLALSDASAAAAALIKALAGVT
jgi:hypothetical protein